MTIGSAENSKKSAEEDIPNPDFTKLTDIRGKLSKELKIDEDSIELSMGMSTDYIRAIDQGATTIRVGSKIFGARNYAKWKFEIKKYWLRDYI